MSFNTLVVTSAGQERTLYERGHNYGNVNICGQRSKTHLGDDMRVTKIRGRRHKINIGNTNILINVRESTLGSSTGITATNFSSGKADSLPRLLVGDTLQSMSKTHGTRLCNLVNGMRWLNSILAGLCYTENRDDTTESDSNSIVSETNTSSTSLSDLSNSLTSRASCSSMEIFETSLQRFKNDLLGVPDYLLERSPNFQPDKYISDFPIRVHLHATTIPYPNAMRFFVTYRPRHGHRERVSVTVHFPKTYVDPTGFLNKPVSANQGSRWEVVPGQMKSVLLETISGIEHFYTNTAVVLHVRTSTRTISSTETPKVFEDKFEQACFDIPAIPANLILADCQSFREREVFFHRHAGSERSAVYVLSLSLICFERKAPFVRAGQKQNDVRDRFLTELHSLHSMRGHQGVTRLLGLVYSNEGSTLRGYLFELPKIANLRGFLMISQNTVPKYHIPWSFRLRWIKQIADTVADAHDRGITLFPRFVHCITISEEGNALIDLSKCAQRDVDGSVKWQTCQPTLHYQRGLRNGFETRDLERTKVFELAHLIWLIAEHQHCPRSYHCRRAQCEADPLYRCSSEHKRPVQLPPCIEAFVELDEILLQARCPSNGEFLSLRQFADNLGQLPIIAPTEMDQTIFESLAFRFLSYDSLIFCWCDNCGDWIPQSEVAYGCHLCNDFDLCQNYINHGVRCWNSEHVFTKWVSKLGERVEIGRFTQLPDPADVQ